MEKEMSGNQKRVAIAGASGVVGQAALTCFEEKGWEIIAISRRTPRISHPDRITHVRLDLRDAAACRDAVASLPAITHLAYCAVYEADDLIKGWRDPQQMEVNFQMLRNLAEPIAASGSMKHISLLQGTKAYGAHIHRIKIPARESEPRDPHPNFYWLQEDYVRELCANFPVTFTIFRPQVVFGDVIGAAMNLIPVIGAYAALRKEAGLSFSYPGGPDYPLEAVDARLLAEALYWAANAPSAANEIFNITNGDVFTWRNIWPVLANCLGASVGDPEPLSMAEWMPKQTVAWDRLSKRRGLECTDLNRFVGQSHHYADFCFCYGVEQTPPPALVSTIKLRQAGFHSCVDTETMFRDAFESMRELKLLP